MACIGCTVAINVKYDLKGVWFVCHVSKLKYKLSENVKLFAGKEKERMKKHIRQRTFGIRHG